MYRVADLSRLRRRTGMFCNDQIVCLINVDVASVYFASLATRTVAIICVILYDYSASDIFLVQLCEDIKWVIDGRDAVFVFVGNDTFRGNSK